MRPRTAALLLLSIAGLFLAGAGLGGRLLRAGLQAANLATEQRLRAIGLTAAQALSQGVSPTLLDRVARDNELEAAYLLDAMLRPLPGAAQQGFAMNLLRIDPDRALQALRGTAQVGAAYHLDAADQTAVDETTVLAGYFPVGTQGNPPRILVLEAGTAFVALPARLRATAWAAGATAFGLAALCALLVLAALRTAAREERLKAEAERGQMIREMAAMVAHELRNPLGTIRAGAELLRERSAPADLIDDILSEVARLSDLTTQFLQFSRDPPLVVSPIDLGALCDELCTRLRREFPDAELKIHRAGDAEVPLLGDADRLRQVLQNLAQNAIEAMHGKGSLEVAARQTAEGGELALRDTGPGIDDEARRSLFVPFHTGKPSGTGLGLTICRRIVEKHGGALCLAAPDSAVPGACFVVRLPRTPPPAATQPS